MRWRLIAALVAAQLVISGPLAAEPVTQTVEAHKNDVGEIDRRGNVFVHRSTGYQYPAALGDMPARETTTYGPRDAEVYYTLRGGANGDPWLDLFVYPAGQSLGDEVALLKSLITNNYQGKAVASLPGLGPVPAGVSEGWFEATLKEIPVITGYRIARDGDWFIKVRMSIPRSGGQAALDLAWKALAVVPWSIAPRPATAVSPEPGKTAD